MLAGLPAHSYLLFVNSQPSSLAEQRRPRHPAGTTVLYAGGRLPRVPLRVPTCLQQLSVRDLPVGGVPRKGGLGAGVSLEARGNWWVSLWPSQSGLESHRGGMPPALAPWTTGC